MKKEIKKNKKDFLALFLGTVESNCHNGEAAREFLSSESLGVDNIISDGLRKIRAMQLEIEAEKTTQEQSAMEENQRKAEKWVDDLLRSMDFSFSTVAQEENLSVSFRNIESLSTEDIRNILVKHFTLKFLNEQSAKK